MDTFKKLFECRSIIIDSWFGFSHFKVYLKKCIIPPAGQIGPPPSPPGLYVWHPWSCELARSSGCHRLQWERWFHTPAVIIHTQSVAWEVTAERGHIPHSGWGRGCHCQTPCSNTTAQSLLKWITHPYNKTPKQEHIHHISKYALKRKSHVSFKKSNDNLTQLALSFKLKDNTWSLIRGLLSNTEQLMTTADMTRLTLFEIWSRISVS